MQLSSRVLGANIVRSLQERSALPVLVIGSDHFQRGDLARIDCFNFLAAANLSRELQALGVKNTRDLFDRVPPASLVLPGVGAIALAVLGAAFEAKGIGGDQPLEAWVIKHREQDATRDFTTFHTLKAKRARLERARSKARRRTRRQAAPGATATSRAAEMQRT